MTTLYGWGPFFDLPGPSPFVMKTDMQMQMLGVEYDRKIADLEAVSKHKAPYVEDEGKIIQDSTFIRVYFENKLKKDLDEGLSEEQRATAWALDRMMENELTPIMAMERWLVDANFEKGPAHFFADIPQPMRQQVCDEVREEMRKTMQGQGLSRHSQDERMQLANWAIKSAALLLGEQDYIFGDNPTAVDATAYAVLAACGTPFFDSPLVELVAKHENIVSYLQRVENRYFQNLEWPEAM